MNNLNTFTEEQRALIFIITSNYDYLVADKCSYENTSLNEKKEWNTRPLFLTFELAENTVTMQYEYLYDKENKFSGVVKFLTYNLIVN